MNRQNAKIPLLAVLVLGVSFVIANTVDGPADETITATGSNQNTIAAEGSEVPIPEPSRMDVRLPSSAGADETVLVLGSDERRTVFTGLGALPGVGAMGTAEANQAAGSALAQATTAAKQPAATPQASSKAGTPAPASPKKSAGDTSAASVSSLVDPESYKYSEVTDKAGWKLTFSDEFTGTSINPNRWHTQFRWDGDWNGERYEYRVINEESQFYVNVLSPDAEHKNKIVPVHNPFKFDGNRLAIQAKKNPLKDRNTNKSFGNLDDMSRQQPFLSGAISSHNKFSQRYGYFEARIRIPGHEGTFPAFWLFHETRASEGKTQRSEIDIMENLGHAPQAVYNTFHYFKNVTATNFGDHTQVKPSPSGQVNKGVDYSKDYHVYAVEWSPGRIVWYIDGVQVNELNNPEVDFEDLYVKLNLAIGGNWLNFPANVGGMGRPSDQRYPTTSDINNFKNPQLEIDYVRVYQRG